MEYWTSLIKYARLGSLKKAEELIKREAKINGLSYYDQLRKFGQRAADENDYPVFKLVVTLKKRCNDGFHY